MDNLDQGGTQKDSNKRLSDSNHEGRDNYFMDIDRMINEGLGGGNVTMQNGLIEASTTDTIGESESEVEEEL